MTHSLLVLHSFMRWLVLITLIASIYRAAKACSSKRRFTKRDDLLRHLTATVAHVQLVIGFTLYLKSPVTAFFFSNTAVAIHQSETTFFSLVHFLMMMMAIVVITIGSALAKRKQSDAEKFRTIVTWFSIGLFLIVLAIPWPFSPFSARPLLRTF